MQMYYYNMIKALIFDFDGVIHDTLEMAYRINQIIMPGLSPEEYKDFFNGNIYKHKKITPEISERYFELQKKEFEKLEIEKEIKQELIQLKERFSLFILTSNKEEALNNYFENNDMIHIFKDVLGLETHASKVEKFNMILKRYDLEKDEYLFITDTLGDILEANKVSIKCIAVDSGFHEKERLEKGSPLRIISKLSDLSKALDDIS